MPNCIQDPQHECFGLAEAEIIKHQIKSMQGQMREDRKERKRDRKSNKKDHKEFYRRMEFSEKTQALTQNQLAQVLSDTQEIKASLIQHGQAISDINTKPAKTWEKRAEQIVGLVIAAVVALVLAKIGLTS